MRIYCFICLFLLIATGCKTDKDSNNALKNNAPISKKSFNITGSFDTYLCDTVFLNAIHEHLVIPVDSAQVIDNTFNFTGVIAEPERYALSFQNYSKRIEIIVENETIELEINSKELDNPKISGSPLNELMTSYKHISKDLFKEIETLYPQFQKARLENDAIKLSEIGAKMKAIELKVSKFTYNFILENRDSYIAAMLLRDQLKSNYVDTLKIRSTYFQLGEKIQHSPDGQIIATALGLH